MTDNGRRLLFATWTTLEPRMNENRTPEQALPLGMASLPYYEISLCLVFLLHSLALLRRFLSPGASALKVPLNSQGHERRSINVKIG